MKLRFLGGRYQGRVIDIPGAELSIGRGSRNDLVLDEDGISRYHARVFLQGLRWFVEDAGSTNGIRVNGKRITEATPIQPGDRIGICGNVLMLSDGGDVARIDHEATAVWDGDGAPVEDQREYSIPWVRISLVIIALLLFVRLAWDIRDRATDEEAPPPAGTPEVSPPSTPAGTPTPPTAPDEPPEDPQPQAWLIPGFQAVEPDDADVFSPDQPTQPDQTRQPRDTAPVAAPEQAAPRPVIIRSEPPGALLTINNEQRGTTPRILTLEPGRYRVALALEGYDTRRALVDVPDLLPDAPYALTQKPGTLRVTSEPDGASIFHGTQLLGTTPLLVRTLPPGDYELRAVLPGFRTTVAATRITAVSGEKCHVSLPPDTGTLEIVTFPGSCEVQVDGVLKGQTAVPPKKLTSTPLRIPGILAGDRHVVVTHPNGSVAQGPVSVTAGETLSVPVRFWFADTRVRLTNGNSVAGMLIKKHPDGGLVLSRAPGQHITLAADTIRAAEDIPVTPSRLPLDQATGEAAMPNRGSAVIRPVSRAEIAGAVRYEAEQLREAVRAMRTVVDLRNQFHGKRLLIRLTPQRLMRDNQYVHVWAGGEVHCLLPHETYTELRRAQAAKRDVTILGTVTDCAPQQIDVGECRLVQLPGQAVEPGVEIE